MGPHAGPGHPHAGHPHAAHPHSTLAAAAAAPFYAQNVAMMSSWRAYDGTGFQRASPYGSSIHAIFFFINVFLHMSAMCVYYTS